VGCKISFISTEKDSKYCSRSCRSINLKLSSYAHKAGGKSRSQIELFVEENLVKDFPNIEFVFNDKETIGSELDAYIPELKMAIEINGIIHYEPIYGEEKLTKVQNRDRQKMINCYNLGIELIVIPLGRKGLSKKQTEEIYNEIHSIIEKNKNRINVNLL
jgi:dTDP-4-amino-4,6-dideoxygalactose transaminase